GGPALAHGPVLRARPGAAPVHGPRGLRRAGATQRALLPGARVVAGRDPCARARGQARTGPVGAALARAVRAARVPQAQRPARTALTGDLERDGGGRAGGVDPRRRTGHGERSGGGVTLHLACDNDIHPALFGATQRLFGLARGMATRADVRALCVVPNRST